VKEAYASREVAPSACHSIAASEKRRACYVSKTSSNILVRTHKKYTIHS